MSKINQGSSQPINSKHSGPTLQELELLINRIEELDAKRDKESVESSDSKQAA